MNDEKSRRWEMVQFANDRAKKPESERLTYSQFSVVYELSKSRANGELSKEEFEKIKKEVN